MTDTDEIQPPDWQQVTSRRKKRSRKSNSLSPRENKTQKKSSGKVTKGDRFSQLSVDAEKKVINKAHQNEPKIQCKNVAYLHNGRSCLVVMRFKNPKFSYMVGKFCLGLVKLIKTTEKS